LFVSKATAYPREASTLQGRLLALPTTLGPYVFKFLCVIKMSQL
jgi:hypothetical protein